MRSKLYFIVGIFLVAEIIYKLVRCPSCDGDFFGYGVSGYTYLAVIALLASVILYSGYQEHLKTKTK